MVCIECYIEGKILNHAVYRIYVAKRRFVVKIERQFDLSSSSVESVDPMDFLGTAFIHITQMFDKGDRYITRSILILYLHPSGRVALSEMATEKALYLHKNPDLAQNPMHIEELDSLITMIM